jgi:hypothetical protein
VVGPAGSAQETKLTASQMATVVVGRSRLTWLGFYSLARASSSATASSLSPTSTGSGISMGTEAGGESL